MYLSKLELNPRCRQVQSELRDPYQMHRTLSKAFEDDSYKDARCLFRVDEMEEGRRLCLLVQCGIKPDWDRLLEVPGYLVAEPLTKEYSPSVIKGAIYAFRLRANPTVKTGGKRVGIYGMSERLEWLARKGDSGGFKVLEANVVSESKQRSRTAAGKEAIFSAAIFNGTLQVTNEKTFLEVLESGLGSAKGFGFGMLSIARLRQSVKA